MPKKRYSTEQIIAKLREAEIELAKGFAPAGKKEKKGLKGSSDSGHRQVYRTGAGSTGQCNTFRRRPD